MITTAADYKSGPEGPPYSQLIGGTLVQEPAPSVAHHDAAMNLYCLLRAHVQAARLGKVFAAPVDVYLDDANVFQPDVLYVSSARLGLVQGDGIHGAPDLAVEVLSPSSRPSDLGPKSRIYAASGTREYWVVDPDRRGMQLRVFGDLASKRDLGWGDAVSSSLFPGLRIKVSDVFAD